MPIILSHSAVCSECGSEPPAGCAHYSLRRGWECVVCGAPAVSSASLLSVAWASLCLWAGGVAFECRMGRLSAYPPVRLLARLKEFRK